MNSWSLLFGLNQESSVFLLIVLINLFLFFCILIPSSIVFEFLQRKLCADMQARVGPNQSGFAGFFQPFADWLKLMQKAVYFNNKSKTEVILYSLRCFQMIVLYSTVAALPWAESGLLFNTDLSAFIPLWLLSLFGVSQFLLGLSESKNNTTGLLSGTRIAAQSLVGLISSLSAVLAVGVHAQGFRWTQIAGEQNFFPNSWTLFSSPFLFIAFVVFLVSGLVFLGLGPFDGGINSLALQGGAGKKQVGYWYSLYKFERFYLLFAWCLLTVCLFLGAWLLPARVQETLKDSLAIYLLLQIAFVVFKTLLLMIGIALISNVIPKLRTDQITSLAFKVLIPLGVISLAGTTFWRSL